MERGSLWLLPNYVGHLLILRPDQAGVGLDLGVLGFGCGVSHLGLSLEYPGVDKLQQYCCIL